MYNVGLVGFCQFLKEAEIPFRTEANILHVEREDLALGLNQYAKHFFTVFIEKYKHQFTFSRIQKAFSFLSNLSVETVPNEEWEKTYTLMQQHLYSIRLKFEFDEKGTKNATYQKVARENEIWEEIKAYADSIKEMKLPKTWNEKKKEETKENVSILVTHSKEMERFLSDPKVVRQFYIADAFYNQIKLFWNEPSFRAAATQVKKFRSVEHFVQEKFGNSMKEKVNKGKDKKSSPTASQCMCCGEPVKGAKKQNFSWIRESGVDVNKKTSAFWNHVADAIICEICNSIYFMIPLGFTVIGGEGFFINANHSLHKMIELNGILLEPKANLNTAEYESYTKLYRDLQHNIVKQNQREIANIQIVKCNSHTIPFYRFNHLSGKMYDLFHLVDRELSQLKNTFVKTTEEEKINVFQHVLSFLYEGKRLDSFLHLLFREKLRRKDMLLLKPLSLLVTMYVKIQQFVEKGEVNMETAERVQKNGYRVKKVLQESQRENKLDGISHQLLNALKTNNKHRFIDIVVRLYMSTGEEVPMHFVKLLENDEEFKQLGYAFVLGLQS